MSDLPDADRMHLTISEAVARTGLSQSTVQRRIDSGAYPKAVKGPDGRYRIPVQDLIDWGDYRHDQPSQAEREAEAKARSLEAQVASLTTDLAASREQTASALTRADTAEMTAKAIAATDSLLRESAESQAVQISSQAERISSLEASRDEAAEKWATEVRSRISKPTAAVMVVLALLLGMAAGALIINLTTA